MSLSIFNHRFLLDENVRIELADFLGARQIDFKKLPKSSPDRLIRSVSLKEKRIVVTNDQDFSFIPQGKIFSVIWLQIPQREAQTLLHCFKKIPHFVRHVFFAV